MAPKGGWEHTPKSRSSGTYRGMLTKENSRAIKGSSQQQSLFESNVSHPPVWQTKTGELKYQADVDLRKMELVTRLLHGRDLDKLETEDFGGEFS